VWLVGTVAALAGAVVAEAFTLVARVADVPMEAAGVWETAAQHNPVGYIVIWSIGGIVLARVFARWAKRPARTFAVTTVAFTVISLAAPGPRGDHRGVHQIVLGRDPCAGGRGDHLDPGDATLRGSLTRVSDRDARLRTAW
jgi:Family of unknown function (DUF6069)